MPITDQGCQLQVLPPTPQPFAELEDTDNQQGLKWKALKGTREQQTKQWPQEGEQAPPVKGDSFPARLSDLFRPLGKEGLSQGGGDIGHANSGSSIPIGVVGFFFLLLLLDEAILMLGSEVILGPSSLATVAL